MLREINGLQAYIMEQTLSVCLEKLVDYKHTLTYSMSFLSQKMKITQNVNIKTKIK